MESPEKTLKPVVRKRIDAKEALAIAGKVGKLLSDIPSLVDGVTAEEAARVFRDASAIIAEIKDALKD
jgi:hypothetical protein